MFYFRSECFENNNCKITSISKISKEKYGNVRSKKLLICRYKSHKKCVSNLKPRKQPFTTIKNIINLSNSQYNQISVKKKPVLDHCGLYTVFIIVRKQFIVTWSKYGNWNLQCIFQGMQHVLHLASIWGLCHISCEYISLLTFNFPRTVWFSDTNLFNRWSIFPWQHQYASGSTNFLLSQFCPVHYIKI